jgi:hypothetical protein
MNNKFHAISMCTLIAAFAASSWATCPTDKAGWSINEGTCTFTISSVKDMTINIPADLEGFVLKIGDRGTEDKTKKINIHCDNHLNTVSIEPMTVNLNAGSSLSIRNRVDAAGLGFDAMYASMAEDYQPTKDMYICDNTLCGWSDEVTGLNALSIVYHTNTNEFTDFSDNIDEFGYGALFSVSQKQYDFGPMQVLNIDGFREVAADPKNSLFRGLLMLNLGMDITTIPDKVKNVLLLRGDAVKEEEALNNAFKGVPSAIDVDYVYLNRTFTVSGSGLYSTLTLPFSISKAKIKNVSNVYAFKNIEGNKAHFTSADMLEAYTPYLIELVDGATGIEFLEGVTLQSSKDKSGKDISTDVQDGLWMFHGTLNYKKWDATADKNLLEGCNDKSCVYGYAASGTYQGQFVRAGAGAHIFPFRAYLFYNKPQSLAPANASYVLRPTVDIPDELELVLDGKDGQTTSIGRFDTRTGEIHINNMKHTYDLKGRRVNGTNNARGAYYGKKVLMK